MESLSFDYAKMAQEQLDEAVAKIKEGTKPAKYEAAQRFHHAAEYYRFMGNKIEAGKAYEEAAGQHIDIDNDHQAATLFSEAGLMYRFDDPKAALLAFNRSVDIFTDKGCYDFAAGRCVMIAATEEAQKNKDKAIEFYQKAANYFEKGSSPRHAFSCRQQVARVCAEEENYDKAIEIYEQTARAYQNNEGLKHHAKGSYLRAAMAHICKDKKKAGEALEKYKKECPGLEDTKEYVFCKELLAACDDKNQGPLIKSHQYAPYLNDPAIKTLLVKIES